jgi:accessory colonization factor AcfC
MKLSSFLNTSTHLVWSDSLGRLNKLDTFSIVEELKSFSVTSQTALNLKKKREQDIYNSCASLILLA